MNRAMSMLDLCARAGKLVTGEKAVVQLVRAGGARAVLLDGGAAENAVKAVTQACSTHGAPLLVTEPFTLGEAIGKEGRMAAAITDAGMAARVIALFDSQPSAKPTSPQQ